MATMNPAVSKALQQNLSANPGVSLISDPLIAGIQNQEAPAIAQYGQQYNQAEAGLASLGASQNYQDALLQQSTGLQSAQLQNQGQANQIQQQGLTGQYGTINTAAAQQAAEVAGYGISQQLLGLQGTEAQQAYGITQGQLEAQNKYLGQQEQIAGGQYGLTQQGIGLQQAALGLQQGNLNYQLPLQQQAQYGQNAASGSTNTVGASNAQGQIGQQYAYQSALLGNQGSQLGVQAGQAALGYQGQQAGFAEQQTLQNLAGTQATEQLQNTQSQLGLQSQQAAYAQQGEVAGYQGSQFQNQNQLALLQNAASGLGISEQQLQNQLSSGLAQIGVQTGQSADQFLQQAATAQAGEAQGYGAVLSNVGALTGLGPQAFSSIVPGLYG